jgi:hypothetical protein
MGGGVDEETGVTIIVRDLETNKEVYSIPPKQQLLDGRFDGETFSPNGEMFAPLFSCNHPYWRGKTSSGTFPVFNTNSGKQILGVKLEKVCYAKGLFSSESNRLCVVAVHETKQKNQMELMWSDIKTGKEIASEFENTLDGTVFHLRTMAAAR